MKVLVTGANGLLGHKLIRQLHGDPEIELIASGRRSSAPYFPDVTYCPLDIADSKAVFVAMDNYKPDAVIHTAAMTNVDKCAQDQSGCRKTNVDAVKFLTSACEANETRLIYLSTDFVFDGKHGPLDESATPAPVNYYGECKAEAEAIVSASNISWAIIRTVLVYGITPDLSRSNIVLWVKENLERNKPINVVNDQFRTPTLAEDLADGCVRVLKKNAAGIFHISGEEMLTPYDIAIRTADYFKLDRSLITPVDSAFLKQPALRPARTGFIIEKAKRELGYEPHSFDDGLRILAAQINDRRLS